MTKLWLPVIWVFLFAAGPHSSEAQSSASLRWLTTINKSRLTETPGEHVLFGPQSAFLIGIAFANVQGSPANGVEALKSAIRVRVEREGQIVPVQVQVEFADVASDQLAVGQTIQGRLVLSSVDGSPFGVGTYNVTLDLTDVIGALRTEDGSPWRGRAKLSETRRLVLKEIVGLEEMTVFHDLEGNFYLGVRDYEQAIVHLENLVSLKPDAWQPNAALGAAYLHVRRYRDAATVLERAMPGWLRHTERRGDVVPDNLARSYLGLGREGDALRTLRGAGLSEREALDRVNQLRSVSPP